MRLIIYFLLLVAAIAVGVVGYQKWKLQNSSPDATGAQAAVAAPRRPRTIYAAGIVEGADRDLDLRFEITGRLVSLPAKVNKGEIKKVKKGDVLAQLDDQDFQAQLREAQANLEFAKAEKDRLINGARPESRKAAKATVAAALATREQAEKTYTRTALAHGRGVASRETLEQDEAARDRARAEFDSATAKYDEIVADARKDELEMAEAKIRVADAQIARANAMIAKTVLKAPIDGTILRTTAVEGELVSPIDPQPIITMSNVDVMHVRAFIEELDAFLIKIGDRAKIFADGNPSEDGFDAVVVNTEPYMTPKKVYTNMPGERVDVKVREVLLRLEKAGVLTVGLPVDVYFDRAAE